MGFLPWDLFVYFFRFGESILTGGLALSLLILPMVIMATREAIRAVPNSIREASYALGATNGRPLNGIYFPILLEVSLQE